MWKCKKGYMIAPINPAKARMLPVFDEVRAKSLDEYDGDGAPDSEANWRARLGRVKDTSAAQLIPPMPMLNPVFLYSKERVMSTLLGIDEKLILDLYLHRAFTVKASESAGVEIGDVYNAPLALKHMKTGEGVDLYLQGELFKKLLGRVDPERIKRDAELSLKDGYVQKRERERLNEKIRIADMFLKTGAKPKWIQMKNVTLPPSEFLVSYLTEEGREASTYLYHTSAMFRTGVRLFGSDEKQRLLTTPARAKWQVLNSTYSRIILGDDYSGVSTPTPEGVGNLVNLLHLCGEICPENELSVVILNSMGLDLYEIG